MTKKVGYLLEKLCDINNIELADDHARRSKKSSLKYIMKHDKNRDLENWQLSNQLWNLTYKTSKYDIFKIYEPKEREIYRLPYYPDRITHHAIMNVTKDLWTKQFIPNTYSCLEGRGIIKCANDLRRDLKRNKDRTKYCLKLDVTKFYPSIDHDVLKEILARKIKDQDFLEILYEIVDSADNGVPIGNYLSQFFANLYLSEFDHWCKEELKCRFYYRYADDIVILSDNKQFLRNVLLAIKLFLKHKLKLKIKGNYQIFPVDVRGIDFVGYVFRHDYIKLRKSIKERMNKLVRKYETCQLTKEQLLSKIVPYLGWLKYSNSKNLLSKIEQRTGIHYSNFQGKKCNISNYYGKEVVIINILTHKKYYTLQCIYNNKPIELDSSNIRQFKYICKHKLPLKLKLKEYEKPTENLQ